MAKILAVPKTRGKNMKKSFSDVFEVCESEYTTSFLPNLVVHVL
jgi:hypothetical protein